MMKATTRSLAAALALAATGALAKAPPALQPSGKPLDCVPIIGIDRTDVRDDHTIDFVMRDRKIYRVTLPQSCPELGFERAFAYETSLSQLCSTDIITVIRQGGGGPRRGASCGLSAFQPMVPIAR